MTKLEPVESVVYKALENKVYEREELLTQDRINTHKAVVELLKGMKKNKNSIKHFSGNGYYNQQGYNQALQDAIQKMNELFGVSNRCHIKGGKKDYCGDKECKCHDYTYEI
jgi:hypothetical protein